MEASISDVAFPASDGTILRGHFYLPARPDGPLPGIVMSHGFSWVKEQISHFAEVFAAAGLAVLLYDHRNHGASDGELRQDIDPWAQIRDMRTAISYLQTRTEVDAGRIGLWGTSYSGGHVLAVAGIDKRVKCVVSQVPLISGIDTLRRVSSAEALPQLQAAFDADRAAGLMGAAPATLLLTSDDPTAAVAFPGPRTYQFLVESEPARRAGSWRNSSTLRSIDYIQEYDVSPFLRHISPAPLLLIVASLVDNTTSTDVALTAFNSALEPKRAIVIPGDHYSPYFADEDFAQCSAAARDWFVQHLAGGHGSAAQRAGLGWRSRWRSR